MPLKKGAKFTQDGRFKPWVGINEFGGAVAFNKYMRRIQGEQYLMIPIDELGPLIESVTKIRLGNMRSKIKRLENGIQHLRKFHAEQKGKKQ